MTKLLKETLNSILNEGAKIPMRVSGINKDGDMYEVRLQLDIDTSEIEAAFVDVEQIISSFDEDHDVQKGSKKGYDIPFIEGGFSRNGYYDSDIINDIANKVPEIILPESDKGEEIGIGHEQLHVNNGTSGEPFVFTVDINGELVKFYISLEYELPRARFHFDKTAKMKKIMNKIARMFRQGKATKYRYRLDDIGDDVGLFTSNRADMEARGYVGDAQLFVRSRVVSGMIKLTMDCEFYTPNVDGDAVRVALDGLKSKL